MSLLGCRKQVRTGGRVSLPCDGLQGPLLWMEPLTARAAARRRAASLAWLDAPVAAWQPRAFASICITRTTRPRRSLMPGPRRRLSRALRRPSRGSACRGSRARYTGEMRGETRSGPRGGGCAKRPAGPGLPPASASPWRGPRGAVRLSSKRRVAEGRRPRRPIADGGVAGQREERVDRSTPASAWGSETPCR